MSDLRSLDRTCGGTGWLNCECGGDFCVCKLNGGMDCPGCEDCEDETDTDDYDPDECEECGGTLDESDYPCSC